MILSPNGSATGLGLTGSLVSRGSSSDVSSSGCILLPGVPSVCGFLTHSKQRLLAFLTSLVSVGMRLLGMISTAKLSLLLLGSCYKEQLPAD